MQGTKDREGRSNNTKTGAKQKGTIFVLNTRGLLIQVFLPLILRLAPSHSMKFFLLKCIHNSCNIRKFQTNLRGKKKSYKLVILIKVFVKNTSFHPSSFLSLIIYASQHYSQCTMCLSSLHNLLTYVASEKDEDERKDVFLTKTLLQELICNFFFTLGTNL